MSICGKVFLRRKRQKLLNIIFVLLQCLCRYRHVCKSMEIYENALLAAVFLNTHAKEKGRPYENKYTR